MEINTRVCIRGTGRRIKAWNSKASLARLAGRDLRTFAMWTPTYEYFRQLPFTSKYKILSPWAWALCLGSTNNITEHWCASCLREKSHHCHQPKIHIPYHIDPSYEAPWQSVCPIYLMTSLRIIKLSCENNIIEIISMKIMIEKYICF